MARTIKDFIMDMKSAKAAFKKALAEHKKEVDKINANTLYTKEAKQQLINEAKESLEKDKRRFKSNLDKAYAEAINALKADSSHLDYKRLDSTFLTWLQMSELAPDDYAELARQSIGKPVVLALLKSDAKRHGFDLDIGSTGADKAAALDAIHNILGKFFDDQEILQEAAGDDTIELHLKAFEPLTADAIRCTATVEEKIISDLWREKQLSKETDRQFKTGFGIEEPNSDLRNLEAFADVKRITAELGNPVAEQRVLEKLGAALTSKQLSEKISPDVVKLTSDFYRRSGDESTAKELKHVADLMLTGTVYVEDYGTRVQPDIDGIHEAHKAAVLHRLEREQGSQKE